MQIKITNPNHLPYPERMKFEGMFWYDKSKTNFTSGTYSVGIYKWVRTRNNKGLKKSKAIVRVHGFADSKQFVYDACDKLIEQMDKGIMPKAKNIKASSVC